MSNMEDVVMKEVANKVITGLDTDKLAAKVLPQLQKKFEKALVDYFDMGVLNDLIGDTDIYNDIGKVMQASLRRSLGIKEPKSKKRRKR